MQEVVYHSNFQIENSYFWFLARNKILMKAIGKVTDLKDGDQVLDAGCGTGGFASVLAEKFKVSCLDTQPLALEYCKKRGLNDLNQCLLHEFDFKSRNIKAIFMLDVIEHIENDKLVVKQAFEAMKPGTWFITTVPAYQWLWSHHDELHMHYRRYNMGNFSELLETAGWKIMYSTYFNSFLFPPAVAKRMVDKITGKKPNQAEPVDKLSPAMNDVFTKIFTAEANFLPAVSFPFGLSILVISQKL